MRKNLLSVSLMGVQAFLSLNSCRSNDEFIQQRSEYTNDSRFSAFWVKNKGETIDFAKAFKEVLTDYSEISGKELYGVKPKTDGSYVNFNVFSQTIALDQGGYAVLFPIVKNFKTSGILMASIDKDARKLGVSLLDDTMDEYSVIVKSMDKRLSDNLKLSASMNRNLNLFAGTDCTKNPYDYDCTIDPVVVPGKPKPKPEPDGPDPGPPIDPNPGTEPTCSEVYGMSQNTFNALKRPPLDCTLPGGGNPGTPTPGIDITKDACGRAKNNLSKSQIKEAQKALREKMEKGQNNNETLYVIGKDGNTRVIEGEQNHTNFNPDIQTEGSVHDHNKLGYSMFPPHDIDSFMNTVRVQNLPPNTNDTSDHSGNAYLGIVTPNADYFMIFNGTKNDIPPRMSYNQVEELQNQFRLDLRRMEIYNIERTDKVLEKLFFKYLEKMGLKDKVDLIKQKKDINYPVNIDSNGSISNDKPC